MKPTWLITAITTAILLPATGRAQVPDRTEQAGEPPGEPATDADANGEDELAAYAQGETIVVVGDEPLPDTATAREIDADTIATASRRSADDLLRLVPGLHTSAHGAEGKGQQFFLRGFDAVHGSDIEIRVAGVPVNELSNVHGQGYVDIGFVIPEVVRQVVGSKGSFGLDQGNFATAGSVSFDLGVPRAYRGTRLSYEAGTTNRHRMLAVVAPQDSHPATFVAAEAVHDGGFGVNRGSERAGALGQFHHELGSSRWIEGFASAYTARFGEPSPLAAADYQAEDVDFYGSYSDDTDGSSSRLLTSVRLHDTSTAWRFTAATHAQWRRLALDENFTGFLLFPEMGDRKSQRHDSLSGGLQLGVERALADRVTLVAGADALVDSIHQREDQITDDGMIWQRNRALAAVQVASSARLGVHAKPSDDLVLQAGARLDGFYFDTDDELDPASGGRDAMAVVSPRLSVAWRPSPAVSLFAAYGRGLRAPEARAVTRRDPPMSAGPDAIEPYDGGDPAITTSDAGELGARVRLADGLEIGGGAFAIALQNEMLFDHVSGVNVQLDRTHRLGAEIDVQYRPLRWIQLRADATFVDARFARSGNPVPAAPRLLATAEARLTPGPWSAGAQFRYLAPRPLAHGATAGSVAVLDLTGAYRVGRWQIGVQIDNALDHRWREGEFHFASWFDRSKPRSQLPQVHYTAGRPLGARVSLTSWF